MASPMKVYLKAMHSKFNYRANWEPQRKLAIGMVGKIYKGQFVPYLNLDDPSVNIPIEISTQGGDGELEYSSSSGVEIAFKAKGDIAPPQAANLGEANAGVVITFGKDKSFYFKANNTTNHSLANLGAVEKEFILKVNAGELNRDYVVITEIIEAESATVIVTNEAGAKIEIEATADAEIGKIDIANAELGLVVKGERKIAAKVIAKSKTQVLYKLVKVKTRFFGNEATGLEIERKADLESESLFEELPFDESEFE